MIPRKKQSGTQTMCFIRCICKSLWPLNVSVGPELYHEAVPFLRNSGQSRWQWLFKSRWKNRRSFFLSSLFGIPLRRANVQMSDPQFTIFKSHIAICGAATIIVAFRTFSRVFVISAFGADDVFCIISMVSTMALKMRPTLSSKFLCIVATIFICVQTNFGLGVPFEDVSPQDSVRFLKVLGFN